MRHFRLILLFSLGFTLCSQVAHAQNRDNKWAINAKVGLNDYGALFNGTPRFGQGFDVGVFRNIAPFLNVGVPFKLGIVKIPNNNNNSVAGSADLVFRLENIKKETKVAPFAFGGAGGSLVQGESFHAAFPFGLGLNVRVSPYTFFTLQGEFRKALAEQRDNINIGAGFIYVMHGREMPVQPVRPIPVDGNQDRDRDSILDVLDKCPDLAGLATANGCPDADRDGVADAEDICPNDAGTAETSGCPDQDGDGFADKDDECPTDAGRVKGCPDADQDGVSDKDDQCPEKAGVAANKGCPDGVKMTDVDDDGTPDERDECPTTPGSANGCPDVDRDGVADKNDKCPEVAGVASNMGCPEGQKLTFDSDNDGVADENDRCPNDSGTANGCPDQDGDGVADREDQCPTFAGTAANQGCPQKENTPKKVDSPVRIDEPKGTDVTTALIDSDNDGVTDNKDRCPTVPGIAANQGCPEVKKEVKDKLALAAKAVQFETSKSLLKEESFSILDDIVEIMRQYPAYSLGISGHTDNVGDDNENFKLSTERARACYDYLVYRGIKAERLRYVGFGENRPIASNNNRAGRDMNRRVEFELFLD
jgi:OmpA-OmpF porin, OOP family